MPRRITTPELVPTDIPPTTTPPGQLMVTGEIMLSPVLAKLPGVTHSTSLAPMVVEIAWSKVAQGSAGCHVLVSLPVAETQTTAPAWAGLRAVHSAAARAKAANGLYLMWASLVAGGTDRRTSERTGGGEVAPIAGADGSDRIGHIASAVLANTEPSTHVKGSRMAAAARTAPHAGAAGVREASGEETAGRWWQGDAAAIRYGD